MEQRDQRQGALEQMLAQGNATVIWAALQELGRVGGREAIDIIDPLTRHADASIRQSAQEAIERIQARLGLPGAVPPPPPPPPPQVQVRPRPKYVPPPVAPAPAPPPPARPTVPPPQRPSSASRMAAPPPPPPPPPPPRPAAPKSRTQEAVAVSQTAPTEMGGAVVSAPRATPPAAPKSSTQEAVAVSQTAPTEMGDAGASAAPRQEARSQSAQAAAQTTRQVAAGMLPAPADLVVTRPDIPPPAPPSLTQPAIPNLVEIPELDWEKRPAG